MTLKPDPAHDTTGNGTESHYDLARQLEMRGYEVRADYEDNEHSEVYFEGAHVGDIHGENPATVTTIAPALCEPSHPLAAFTSEDLRGELDRRG